MGSSLNTFILFRVVFIATLFTLVIGPVCHWLTREAGLVDVPGSAPHQQHATAVPVAGGLTLALSVFVISYFTGALQFQSVWPILLASSLIFLFGLLDNYLDLHPFLKLAGQIIASLALIGSGIQVPLFLHNWLNIGLTIVWMVGVTNAFNFVDSMDGQAIGLAAVACAFFMLVTIDSHQNDLLLFSAILLSACFGTFYYNSTPAYYFLSDSGSQWQGFILAGIGSVYIPFGFSSLNSWFIPALLAGVPLFDAALVVISRLRRRRPIYQSARDHTFQRLVASGMSSNRAVLTIPGILPATGLTGIYRPFSAATIY
jgi:UDP-GlcNAc:undecaprenyl-phosphate GlcNAc-1-phosphate transferase